MRYLADKLPKEYRLIASTKGVELHTYAPYYAGVGHISWTWMIAHSVYWTQPILTIG